mgnify:CR=1 FL=1
MLAVDVNHRISIEDIFIHDWITDEHEFIAVVRQPPVAKFYHTVPKAQIVNYMTTVFNFMEDDIYDSVVERKTNAVAATYHLLHKRFEAGIHLVGYSVSVKDAPQKQGVASAKSVIENIELPHLLTDETEVNGEVTLDPKSKLKTYAQLMKDCKLRSAQNDRSGSSVVRQKEITLRRYKTRADVLKGTRGKEQLGFLPDFVLTYNQNHPHPQGTSHSKGPDRFEWEQTFVISKKETSSIDSNEAISKRSSLRQPTNHSQSEFTTYQTFDGRVTRNADSVLPVPPSSPITPALINHDFKPVVGRQLPPTPAEMLPKDINTTNKSSCALELTYNSHNNQVKSLTEQCSNDPILMFQKQKMQLARFTSSINGKNAVAQSQCGRRKALTNKEARSYFQEIERAKVIGQGMSRK